MTETPTTDVQIRQKNNISPLAEGSTFAKEEEMKAVTRVYQITTADDKSSMSESQNSHAPEYPYNETRTTLSGHFEEWDDTPGAERISKGHRTGTYEEIQSDGSRCLKIVGDDFEISLKDRTLVVGGNLSITVQGDARLLVKGNLTQKIGGDLQTIVHGNMITRVRGKSLYYSLDDIYFQTGRNLRTRSTYKTEMISTLDMNIQANTVFNLNVPNNTLTMTAKNMNLGVLRLLSQERLRICTPQELLPPMEVLFSRIQVVP